LRTEKSIIHPNLATGSTYFQSNIWLPSILQEIKVQSMSQRGWRPQTVILYLCPSELHFRPICTQGWCNMLNKLLWNTVAG